MFHLVGGGFVLTTKLLLQTFTFSFLIFARYCNFGILIIEFDMNKIFKHDLIFRVRSKLSRVYQYFSKI